MMRSRLKRRCVIILIDMQKEINPSARLRTNPTAIKLVIGLGNPGKEYANTYHNVGILFAQYLKNTLVAGGCTPIASNIYMNESGRFVAAELKKRGIKPEELLIAHDDSDIALGNFKISFMRGAAGHHGIESIIATLKTNSFWRIRIGVRKNSEASKSRQKAGSFVLRQIKKEDQNIIASAFAKAAASLLPLLKQDVERFKE